MINSLGYKNVRKVFSSAIAQTARSASHSPIFADDIHASAID